MPHYHVTLAANHDSIYAKGVDPAYATGRRKVSWFVSKGRLPWAIAHISNRHNVSVRDLVVCWVKCKARHFKKTCWPGVWTSDQINRADRWAPAAAFVPGVLDGEWYPACEPTDG